MGLRVVRGGARRAFGVSLSGIELGGVERVSYSRGGSLRGRGEAAPDSRGMAGEVGDKAERGRVAGRVHEGVAGDSLGAP